MPVCLISAVAVLGESPKGDPVLWALKVPWDDPQLLWAALPLAAALLIGAGIIYYVDRWRKQAEEPAAPNEDQLNHYRALYERGELSQDEYNRLKLLLGGRMRKELNLPDPPAPPKPPEAEPPSTGIQQG
jgi:hypothetical protein